MRLVAMMMVGQGEYERYLPWSLPSLLAFCDLVVVRVEADPAPEMLTDGPKLRTLYAPPGSFFAHEGRARQALLEHTLAEGPTHVLAIDADELVTDGSRLRAACESRCPVLTMPLLEAWNIGADGLQVRVDGGWGSGSGCVWQVPERVDVSWRIQDRALACGRDPVAVRSLRGQGCSEPAGTEIVHLGWANRAERQARYERYVTHDGGRFHASAHLQSIMWLDSRVRVQHRAWPAGWPPGLRAALEERANRA